MTGDLRVLAHASLREQMAHPWDFAGSLAAMAIYYSLQLTFFATLLDFAPALAGWNEGDFRLLVFTFVVLSLLIDAVSASVTQFFRVVHGGGIEPFLAKPCRVTVLMLSRWCQPAHLAIAIAVVVVTALNVSWDAPGYPAATVVVGYLCACAFALLANVSFVVLVNCFTFTAHRPLPVEYVREELMRLGLVPVAAFPRGVSFGLVMCLPISLSAAVPVAVTKGQFHWLWMFVAGTGILVCLTLLALRFALRRFDGVAG